jgi:hypothetical protein
MVTFGAEGQNKRPRADHRIHLQMNSFAERDEYGKIVSTPLTRYLADVAASELVDREPVPPRIPLERVPQLAERILELK